MYGVRTRFRSYARYLRCVQIICQEMMQAPLRNCTIRRCKQTFGSWDTCTAEVIAGPPFLWFQVRGEMHPHSDSNSMFSRVEWGYRSNGIYNTKYNQLQQLYKNIKNKCSINSSIAVFIFPSHLLPWPLFSCSLLVVAKFRSHVKGYSPPPHY